MPFKKTIVGVLATSTLAVGGLDASVLNEVPMDKVEMIKGERVEVKQIGDRVETTMSWKDQAGIKVSYDMGVPTLDEKIKDKRKKQAYLERKNADEFEYGVILNERPPTNTFCYDVENADQYDFFKQPPLTQKEIDKGAFRPENVINSFAVYHKVLKNHVTGQTNYETGKAYHRFTPQAVDFTGNTSWGDSNFNGTQFCDTFDGLWLDGANYPVKI